MPALLQTRTLRGITGTRANISVFERVVCVIEEKLATEAWIDLSLIRKHIIEFLWTQDKTRKTSDREKHVLVMGRPTQIPEYSKTQIIISERNESVFVSRHCAQKMDIKRGEKIGHPDSTKDLE